MVDVKKLGGLLGLMTGAAAVTPDEAEAAPRPKYMEELVEKLKSGDYTFTNFDFRELPNDDWNDKTFVYADPPYLITCATYNEQDGWNETLEKELLSYLDNLNERGIRFALSNVLYSKGKENKILLDWIDKNIGRYRVIYLDYNYANSNYHTKDKTAKAEEVLIVNY